MKFSNQKMYENSRYIYVMSFCGVVWSRRILQPIFGALLETIRRATYHLVSQSTNIEVTQCMYLRLPNRGTSLIKCLFNALLYQLLKFHKCQTSY